MISDLKSVFEHACKAHPDIMEPWIVRLDGLEGEELIEGLRRALRQTIRQRYPNPAIDAAVDASQGSRL